MKPSGPQNVIGTATPSHGHNSAFVADADRTFIQDKIFRLLAQRHQQPINESQMQKFKDIVKRLEEGLFNSAQSKDEYLNTSSLESRLHNLIKRSSINSRPPPNSSFVTTMMPTPGMALLGISNLLSSLSMDASVNSTVGGNVMQPANSNPSSVLSTGVMQSSSFSHADGILSNSFQQTQANGDRQEEEDVLLFCHRNLADVILFCRWRVCVSLSLSLCAPLLF